MVYRLLMVMKVAANRASQKLLQPPRTHLVQFLTDGAKSRSLELVVDEISQIRGSSCRAGGVRLRRLQRRSGCCNFAFGFFTAGFRPLVKPANNELDLLGFAIPSGQVRHSGVHLTLI